MEFSAEAPLPQSEPQAEPPIIAGTRVEWTLKDLVYGILCFFGVFLLLPVPFVLPLYAAGLDDDDRAYLIAASGVTFIIYLGIIWAAAQFSIIKYGGGIERLGIRPPGWSTLGWAGVALVGAFTVGLLYQGFIGLFDLDALRQSCDDQVPSEIRDDALLLGLSAVSAVIFAPLAEEIFFRGFLFTGLARAFGIALGILLSGILFGAAHLPANPDLWKSLIPFMAIGCVFAFAYWRSENLLSSILAHFAFNLTSMIVIASTVCEPT
jgi:membrane protease YdiL (CAAX protease family)